MNRWHSIAIKCVFFLFICFFTQAKMTAQDAAMKLPPRMLVSDKTLLFLEVADLPSVIRSSGRNFFDVFYRRSYEAGKILPLNIPLLGRLDDYGTPNEAHWLDDVFQHESTKNELINEIRTNVKRVATEKKYLDRHRDEILDSLSQLFSGGFFLAVESRTRSDDGFRLVFGFDFEFTISNVMKQLTLWEESGLRKKEETTTAKTLPFSEVAQRILPDGKGVLTDLGKGSKLLSIIQSQKGLAMVSRKRTTQLLDQAIDAGRTMVNDDAESFDLRLLNDISTTQLEKIKAIYVIRNFMPNGMSWGRLIPISTFVTECNHNNCFSTDYKVEPPGDYAYSFHTNFAFDRSTSIISRIFGVPLTLLDSRVMAAKNLRIVSTRNSCYSWLEILSLDIEQRAITYRGVIAKK